MAHLQLHTSMRTCTMQIIKHPITAGLWRDPSVNRGSKLMRSLHPQDTQHLTEASQCRATSDPSKQPGAPLVRHRPLTNYMPCSRRFHSSRSRCHLFRAWVAFGLLSCPISTFPLFTKWLQRDERGEDSLISPRFLPNRMGAMEGHIRTHPPFLLLLPVLCFVLLVIFLVPLMLLPCQMSLPLLLLTCRFLA